MASKAKIVDGTDPMQPETAVEEREGLLHSTREQNLRNRAYAIYLRVVTVNLPAVEETKGGNVWQRIN